MLGTGGSAGVRGAERYVSLASVLERGDKRGARPAVADRSINALALVREGRRLDLLAEVARRYLAAAAMEAQAFIWATAVERRERALEAAASRVAAGGAPESVRLTAMAAAVAARGVERAGRAATLDTTRLAILWGVTDPSFSVPALETAELPQSIELRAAIERLANAPEMRAFSSEERLREARVQLARTALSPDLQWSVGLRRLEGDHDWGLMGTLAPPLGTRSRAEPGIRAAEAELAAVSLEREAAMLQLKATLADAQAQLASL